MVHFVNGKWCAHVILILLNPMEMKKLYAYRYIHIFITSIRGLFSEIDSHAYMKMQGGMVHATLYIFIYSRESNNIFKNIIFLLKSLAHLSLKLKRAFLIT